MNAIKLIVLLDDSARAALAAAAAERLPILEAAQSALADYQAIVSEYRAKEAAMIAAKELQNVPLSLEGFRMLEIAPDEQSLRILYAMFNRAHIQCRDLAAQVMEANGNLRAIIWTAAVPALLEQAREAFTTCAPFLPGVAAVENTVPWRQLASLMRPRLIGVSEGDCASAIEYLAASIARARLVSENRFSVLFHNGCCIICDETKPEISEAA